MMVGKSWRVVEMENQNQCKSYRIWWTGKNLKETASFEQECILPPKHWCHYPVDGVLPLSFPGSVHASPVSSLCTNCTILLSHFTENPNLSWKIHPRPGSCWGICHLQFQNTTHLVFRISHIWPHINHILTVAILELGLLALLLFPEQSSTGQFVLLIPLSAERLGKNAVSLVMENTLLQGQHVSMLCTSGRRVLETWWKSSMAQGESCCWM